MSEKSVGERIAEIGESIPPEALEGLATDQEAAHRESTQLRAENDRLREALRHYAEGYPGGIGETAREALLGSAPTGRSPVLREVRPGLYERVDD